MERGSYPGAVHILPEEKIEQLRVHLGAVDRGEAGVVGVLAADLGTGPSVLPVGHEFETVLTDCSPARQTFLRPGATWLIGAGATLHPLCLAAGPAPVSWPGGGALPSPLLPARPAARAAPRPTAPVRPAAVHLWPQADHYDEHRTFFSI